MDDFALNGAAINGQANEWILLDGAASIALTVSGAGTLGAVIGGAADIQVTATAAFSSGIMGGGAADIALGADLVASVRRMASGAMGIALTANLDAYKRIMLVGGDDMVLDADLDLTRRAMGQGEFDIVLDLEGEGRIVGRVQIEGACGIVLDPFVLDGRRTAAHLPDMPMVVSLSLDGSAWLEMHSAAGAMDIELALAGQSSQGARVGIEGHAGMELFARLEGRRYALVGIQGDAAIELVLAAERAGLPPIPTVYVPSPRRFSVQRQARERRIHFDRRL